MTTLYDNFRATVTSLESPEIRDYLANLVDRDLSRLWRKAERFKRQLAKLESESKTAHGLLLLFRD